jgi:hypothetical protein
MGYCTPNSTKNLSRRSVVLEYMLQIQHHCATGSALVTMCHYQHMIKISQQSLEWGSIASPLHSETDSYLQQT